MVTINDQAENDWLLATFGAGNTRDFQIGLWAEHLSDFVWMSGEPVTYTNWFPGCPAVTPEAREVYMNAEDGKWIDIVGDFIGPAVFEVDGVVPEPTTLVLWTGLGVMGLAAGWWRRRSRAGRSAEARQSPCS